MQNPMLNRFKAELEKKPTYSQMVPADMARALFAELKAKGFRQVSYKATAFRLVMTGKGYFTFSPKGDKVHVLAKRFVKEA